MAGSRRRQLALLTTLVVAGGLTGFALARTDGGFASTSGSFATESTSPSTLWTWGSGIVPGTRVDATANVRKDASRADVAVSSIRAAATAKDGLTLLFGENSRGVLCSASMSSGFLSGFNCLSAWSDRFAMVLYSTASGPKGGGASHSSLVGVGRPDVARVSVKTLDGVVKLRLNRWRGFSYAVSLSRAVPLSITAYDANGRKLDTEQVAGRGSVPPP